MAHEFTHIGIGEDKRHRLLAVRLDEDYDETNEAHHLAVEDHTPLARRHLRTLRRCADHVPEANRMFGEISRQLTQMGQVIAQQQVQIDALKLEVGGANNDTPDD